MEIAAPEVVGAAEDDVMKDETLIVLTVVCWLDACTVVVESGVVDTIEAVIVTVSLAGRDARIVSERLNMLARSVVCIDLISKRFLRCGE